MSLVNNGKRVMIFNGPPGSGKDHACDFIESLYEEAWHRRFKDHLFECTMALFNIDEETFFELYMDRDTKESPTCYLRGMSPREAMIFTSETVIKPNFGKDYFGMTAAENLNFGLNVFSDGGFTEELEPVYNECDGNMLIVQIHRDGCDFSNDSRQYLDEFEDVPIIKIFNNSSLENFELQVANITNSFLAGEYHNET